MDDCPRCGPWVPSDVELGKMVSSAFEEGTDCWVDSAIDTPERRYVIKGNALRNLLCFAGYKIVPIEEDVNEY